MFTSPIPDVAFGIVFSFLAVSLAAGAAVEALASLLRLRSKTLLSGLKALVNDPDATGLVLELYRHAGVNPRDHGRARSIADVRNKPTYIAPLQFAQALLDILGLSGVPSGAEHMPAVLQRLEARIPSSATAAAAGAGGGDDQLNQLLSGMIQRAQGNVAELRSELAAWFDAAMDRVSGSYKRRAQLLSFLFALAIAALFNLDCISLALRLWQQPALTHGLALDQGASLKSVLEETNKYLPVGWHIGATIWPNASWTNPVTWIPSTSAQWLMVLGWLITGFASLFGAPFWFDLLQRVARLRGSGPSPDDRRREGRLA